MAYYMAVIEVLVDVDNEGESCDAISETMRPLLRKFADSESCVIDWRYHAGHSIPTPHSGEGFEYAEVIETAKVTWYEMNRAPKDEPILAKNENGVSAVIHFINQSRAQATGSLIASAMAGHDGYWCHIGSASPFKPVCWTPLPE